MVRNYRAFIKRARASVDYWLEVALGDFTEDLARRMDDQGVTQAELSRRLRATPAYVSRVMGGSENLSLRTMTKLALALDAKIRIHVADLECATVWRDVFTNINYQDATLMGAAMPAHTRYSLSGEPDVKQASVGGAGNG